MLGADLVAVYYGDSPRTLAPVAEHGDPGDDRGAALGALARAVIESGLPQIAGSGLAVPLRRRGAVDGAVCAGYLEERPLGEGDLQLLGSFAELAALAVRDAEALAAAERAAALDSLTGCLNHAAFQSRLREEISRAERTGEPFTLVLLDLDDFKAINDTLGHLTGDSVLRAVGEVLRDVVRLHDQVARFGGDEFALILPDTDEQTAEGVVARALEAILSATPPEERAVSLGARAGVAQWRTGEQANALLDRADAELRERKAGRGAPARGDSARGPVDLRAEAPEAAERREELRRLAGAGALGARLARLLDPRAIAGAAVTELHGVFGYELCSVVRLHEDVHLSAVAAQSQEGAGWTPPRSGGALTRCLEERREVLVGDAPASPVYADGTASGIRSELAVPLYMGPEVWGAIDLQSTRAGAFGEADVQLARSVADQVGAALSTADIYRSLERMHIGTAQALASAVEERDGLDPEQARLVADLALEVGYELELGEEELRDLRYGAILHNVGKLAVPEAILRKEGELDAAEMDALRAHPVAGERMLEPVPFLDEVRPIVRHVRERFDGGGYPDGLAGERIPLGARIVAVCDAWLAMGSDRPYRRRLAHGEARRRLEDGAGTQFDPHAVEALVRVLDRRAG